MGQILEQAGLIYQHIAFGDVAGHEFRGNQWSSVTSARMENVGTGAGGAKHNKFYESAVYKDKAGAGVHVKTYGSLKPGAAHHMIVDHHPTVRAAVEAHSKTVNTRLDRGYDVVDNTPFKQGAGPRAAAYDRAAASANI